MNTRMIVALLAMAGLARAEAPDPFMGYYAGNGAEARVSPEGDGVWRAVVDAGTVHVVLRGKAESGKLVLTQPSDEGSVTVWSVAGPFRQEGKGGWELVDIAFPPEKPASATVSWKPVVANPAHPAVVDLAARLGCQDCAAYLRATIDSPVDQDAELRFGGTNPVKAWINAAPVATDWSMKAFDPIRNGAKVKLVKGANTVMLKSTQDGYSWLVSASFRGAVGLRGVAGPRDGLPAWEGVLQGDAISLRPLDGSSTGFVLSRTDKRPPTLGLKPPSGAIVLLPPAKGLPQLGEWTNQKWNRLPGGVMEAGGGDTRTKRDFGSCRLHVEFMTPYQPGSDRDRGNSGVYLQDRYEAQILETFGLEPDPGVCGAIYRVAAPKVEASLPMLTWQTFDIEFHAAKFRSDGGVEAPARISVVQNGLRIIDNVAVERETGGGPEGTVAEGPIRLQDHGAPVRFRNIWLVPLPK